MHIIIDYNGSIAECRISGCVPSAQYPNVNPMRTYEFNNADPYSQQQAMDAFRTIIEHWKREHKGDVISADISKQDNRSNQNAIISEK